MKSFYFSVLSLFIATSSWATSLHRGCNADLALEAKNFRIETERQRDLGAMAPSEVVRTQIAEIKMNYCAGLTDLQSACQALLPLVGQGLDTEKKKFALGVSTSFTVIASIEDLGELQSQCQMTVETQSAQKLSDTIYQAVVNIHNPKEREKAIKSISKTADKALKRSRKDS